MPWILHGVIIIDLVRHDNLKMASEQSTGIDGPFECCHYSYKTTFFVCLQHQTIDDVTTSSPIHQSSFLSSLSVVMRCVRSRDAYELLTQ